MIFFALLTAGYIIGVVTTLFIFPPGTNELAEQEKDALRPIRGDQPKRSSQKIPSFNPASVSSITLITDSNGVLYP